MTISNTSTLKVNPGYNLMDFLRADISFDQDDPLGIADVNNKKQNMSKRKFERKSPECKMGTIDHVDHGKTTLTASLRPYPEIRQEFNKATNSNATSKIFKHSTLLSSSENLTTDILEYIISDNTDILINKEIYKAEFAGNSE